MKKLLRQGTLQIHRPRPKTTLVLGPFLGNQLEKTHYYLATDLIRCNVEIEIQNMVSIRWKLSGWKTCFSEPENPIHPSMPHTSMQHNINNITLIPKLVLKRRRFKIPLLRVQ